MPYSRRRFIDVSIRSVSVLTAANLLQSFAGNDFVLPAKDRIRLRFAVASDGHYGEAGTEYDRFYDDIVNWINREKETRGLAFSFINGDLFHDDPALLPKVKERLDKLSMPYHVSHGNHDKIDEQEWQNTFGSGWNYSFAQEDISFVVLNTASVAGEYICPDLSWATNELRLRERSKYLFVFMHITPVKWASESINCIELVEMFDRQSNLRMVFHGHDHKEDNVRKHNEKHYFFDAHFGGSWGTPYKGYRIVEILHSGDIVTYQMNPAVNQVVNNDRLRRS